MPHRILLACLAVQLLALPGTAQGLIVYRESFDDNRNGWKVYSTKQLSTTVAGGAYRMTGLGELKPWPGKASRGPKGRPP